MRHLDLFSGIGGAALAVESVWPGAKHIFCEIDPYCQALLKLRFPTSYIHGDIRTLTADTESIEWSKSSQKGGRKSRIIRLGSEEPDGIYILTGGFPCQPFSGADEERERQITAISGQNV